AHRAGVDASESAKSADVHTIFPSAIVRTARPLSFQASKGVLGEVNSKLPAFTVRNGKYLHDLSIYRRGRRLDDKDLAFPDWFNETKCSTRTKPSHKAMPLVVRLS